MLIIFLIGFVMGDFLRVPQVEKHWSRPHLRTKLDAIGARALKQTRNSRILTL